MTPDSSCLSRPLVECPDWHESPDRTRDRTRRQDTYSPSNRRPLPLRDDQVTERCHGYQNYFFVARMNGWMLLPLTPGVPLLVISLIAFHLVREEWELPILAVCIGAVIAISIVRPWLWQTVSFWLAVVASCTVQVFAGHWISVHQAPHSRGTLKGAAFLAIVFGYAVGAALFLSLQKLKPKEGPH